MWFWNTVDCNEALAGIHNLAGCIEMNDDTHPFKTGTTPEGKVWGNDKNGFPTLMDIPAPSPEVLIEMAATERSERIAYAIEKIGLWQTKLQLAVITDDEKAELLIWLKYIDDVKAVDVSAAPDISWPEPPEN